jgi:hypothetical protein
MTRCAAEEALAPSRGLLQGGGQPCITENATLRELRDRYRWACSSYRPGLYRLPVEADAASPPVMTGYGG